MITNDAYGDVSAPGSGQPYHDAHSRGAKAGCNEGLTCRASMHITVGSDDGYVMVKGQFE